MSSPPTPHSTGILSDWSGEADHVESAVLTRALCPLVEHQLREALALLQKAERIAQEAALGAAQQAGACGLSYTPLPNVHVNLMDVHKVNQSPTSGREAGGDSF